MALLDKTALVAQLNTNIATNGTQAITGALLNDMLLDIIDSVPNLEDDIDTLGLSDYDSTKTYNRSGERQAVIYSGAIYQAKAIELNITGAWNAAKWDLVTASGFVNGGEAGGSARTLGNTDNYNLGFKTNNTERVRILDTGEVGIGSTTDSDIDDAQLFIRTAKTKAAILYNYAEAGTSVLSFQVNNSASARKETFLIDAYFADDTASSEVGLVDFNIKKNGSLSPQTIISFAGLYDDGVNPQADSLTTYMTSALHVILDDLDGIAAADYRVLKVDGSTGVFDFRANGDTYLTGAMAIGATSLSASAAFEVVSTTKGVRFPNMTTAQRDAIATPVAGLQIFNTTTSTMNLYDGSSWRVITAV